MARLADLIGAKCFVNISGARGEIMDGPYRGNYSKETFELIVETVRYIIDEANRQTLFLLLNDAIHASRSPDSYLQLIGLLTGKFAAHLDPVNKISSPTLFQ
jgi:hypothetical protein